MMNFETIQPNTESNEDNNPLNEIKNYGGITPQKEQELLDKHRNDKTKEEHTRQEILDLLNDTKKLETGTENMLVKEKESALFGLRQLEALRLMNASTPLQIRQYSILVEDYRNKFDPNYESTMNKKEAEEFFNTHILKQKEQGVENLDIAA